MAEHEKQILWAGFNDLTIDHYVARLAQTGVKTSKAYNYLESEKKIRQQRFDIIIAQSAMSPGCFELYDDPNNPHKHSMTFVYHVRITPPNVNTPVLVVYPQRLHEGVLEDFVHFGAKECLDLQEMVKKGPQVFVDKVKSYLK